MSIETKAPSEIDVVVVGAGFAGIYLLHRLRELGLRTRVLEASSGIGGTWYANRYPGARCDSESVEYSYSFSKELEQEWVWSERFAGQPEILRYLEHVVDRFDLRRDITLGTRVTRATFDESTARWTIESDRGEIIRATYCVMATGCLSATQTPDLAGADLFEGPVIHTGAWPHEGFDFRGMRVGVVGTGSSGVQLVPEIAAQAEKLYVFQRTPNFSVPARNAPITTERESFVKANYGTIREQARRSFGGYGTLDFSPVLASQQSAEERTRVYEAAWDKGGPGFLMTFGDLLFDETSNKTARDFVHAKIRGLVDDPAVAEVLMPHDHPLGTKRICVDTNYYATFNRPNVTLVDLRKTPIEAIAPKGIRTSREEIALDCIVYATGFDAMTGALSRIDIRGRGGVRLRDKWKQGPRTYLGLAVAGFPNLFTVTGPGSPSVVANMTTAIEQHVEWISGCIQHMANGKLAVVEASEAAEADWVQHVDAVAQSTLLATTASWYAGANIPGKPRVFMPYLGGFGPYRDRCDSVARNGYEGFVFQSARMEPRGRSVGASSSEVDHGT